MVRNEPTHFLNERGAMWTFFPELPIAVALVLAAPVWAVFLAMNGHPVAAIALVVTLIPVGYAAVWGFRTNQKWAAHLGILGILIVAWAVNANT